MRLIAGHSLRGRLLAFLLAAIFLAALMQGAIAYRGALVQTDEIFDYQLQRIALSLSNGNPLFSTGPDGGLLDDPAARDLIIQIWTPDGVRLFRSTPKLVLPDRVVLGFSTVEAEGATYRMYSLEAPLQIIQVAQDVRVRTSMARSLALRTIWPIAAMAPLLMLVVWWVVSHSLMPVDRARRQVAARQADDLSPVSESGLPDEVRPLVHELNLLLDRVRQAFAAQQQFVGDAAHELRSPLAALKLQLQFLQRSDDEASRQVAIGRLGAGIERATRLVEQLLSLARQEAPGMQFATVDLADVVRTALTDVLPQARARGIDIGMEGASGARVTGQGEALALLVRNLLDNAVKYAPASGRVDIGLASDERGATLDVDDDGPGIPPSERGRVFDRFYRSHSADTPGSGLGLAIVKAIAGRHGATVELLDSPLGGLRVRVRFPPPPT
ncbi:two-component sensor histidine kinase [Pigmentiphaga sp. NML080357]|uniref:ATP-binding protein n=1 Tax=Pigmentiphaga sp. NML080357 TaxID=2008675 RepID=UPI000B416B86|nr:ATP-binding protein [Pigmentiphaga sp. NML080357]OVZ59287.1 two-component sensor histidine kinase [Pigmentiphaga sp. NML080357]